MVLICALRFFCAVNLLVQSLHENTVSLQTVVLCFLKTADLLYRFGPCKWVQMYVNVSSFQARLKRAQLWSIIEINPFQVQYNCHCLNRNQIIGQMLALSLLTKFRRTWLLLPKDSRPKFYKRSFDISSIDCQLIQSLSANFQCQQLTSGHLVTIVTCRYDTLS